MIFTTGLGSPEGPLLLPDDSWLVVEMAPERGCVSHISPDGKSVRTVAKTGRPNGLALGADGTIWVAESLRPALLRMQLDGSYQVWLTACEGQDFIFPNDLAFGPNGLLYMTDSGIHTGQLSPSGDIRPDYASLDYDGRVYQIDVQQKSARCVDRGLRFANGIAFGPDGQLYVNETITGNVYRYQISGDKVGQRQLFGNVNDPQGSPGWRGPDGMKFGADGNLYVTVYNQGDVTVLDPQGTVLRRLPTAGLKPTNLVFSQPGDHKIYVTEVQHGTLEALDVKCDGFPLHG
jgi:gluconolactonase